MTQEGFLADLRLAVRHLRRAPGYTATAVLTFALAIGANSAISAPSTPSCCVPCRWPRPAAWPSSGRPDQRQQGHRADLPSPPRMGRAGKTFTRAAIIGSHNWNAISAGAENRPGSGSTASRPVSSTRWASGRSRPGAAAGRRRAECSDVAVLNHATWVRRFGADPKVVGTTMTLDGGPVEIVGVMPPGFDIPSGAEFWMPVVPAITNVTPPRPATSTRWASPISSDGSGRVSTWRRPHRTGRRRGAARSRTSRTDEVGRPHRRHAAGRLRVRSGPLGAAGAVGGGRRAAAHRLRQRLGPDADARVAAPARARHPSRARRHAGRDRPAVARRDSPRRLRRRRARSPVRALAHPRHRRARPRRSAAGRRRLGGRHRGVLHLRRRRGRGPHDRRDAAAPGGDGQPDRSARGRADDERPPRDADALAAARRADRDCRSRCWSRPDWSSGASAPCVTSTWDSHRSRALAESATGAGREGGQSVDAESAGAPARAAGRRGRRRGLSAALDAGPDRRRRQRAARRSARRRAAPEANPILNHQIATPGYFEALRVPLRAGRLFTDRDRADMPRVAIVSETTAKRLWPGEERDRQASGDVDVLAGRAAAGLAHGRRRGQRRALSLRSAKCSSTSTIRRCRSIWAPTMSSSAPRAIRAACWPACVRRRAVSTGARWWTRSRPWTRWSAGPRRPGG